MSVIFKIAQAMVRNPEKFDLKDIDGKSCTLSYKEALVARIDGKIYFNYKGKDYPLEAQEHVVLTEAFENVLEYQKDMLLSMLGDLVK